MIFAFAVFVLCQLAGEVLARATGVPVPGPVIGMIFLFGAMLWRGSVPDEFQQASRGLLSHLSLLFVPAGAGVMLHFARLKAEWLPISAALVASAALTLAVTGAVFAAVTRLLAGRPAESE